MEKLSQRIFHLLYIYICVCVAAVEKQIFCIPASFLDDIALEFGNACNGILRGTACYYQAIVLGLNCLDPV